MFNGHLDEDYKPMDTVPKFLKYGYSNRYSCIVIHLSRTELGYPYININMNT